MGTFDHQGKISNGWWEIKCWLQNKFFSSWANRENIEMKLGTVSKKKLMEGSIKLAEWVLNDPVFHKKKKNGLNTLYFA